MKNEEVDKRRSLKELIILQGKKTLPAFGYVFFIDILIKSILFFQSSSGLGTFCLFPFLFFSLLAKEEIDYTSTFPWDATGKVVGRVFEDTNGNGIFDPGEKGFVGVRLILENGVVVKTGIGGKFFADHLKSGYHIIKIDEWSLPPGYILINQKEMSKFINIPPAGVVEVNFYIKQDW